MRKVMINGMWPVVLPESPADEWEGNMKWHNNTWEQPRLLELERMIKAKPGCIVLYIGAYKGDMAALLATWGARLILVEASPGFWPLIRETWAGNGLDKPLGMFSGLISRKSTSDLTGEQLRQWPGRSEMFVEGTTGFAHLAESGGHMPEITIDDICSQLMVTPDIVTMDIEGSELEALYGGIKLIESRLTTFMLSVHPEFMFHNHGTYERELHDLLRNHGYKEKWIDYDHEHHWLYTPPEAT